VLRIKDVLVALLSHPTQEAAAKALGVDRTTLWRFMKRDAFRLAYESVSYRLFYNATSQLQQVAMKGVDILTQIMCDAHAPVFARVLAARYAVQLAFKASAVQDEAVERREEAECFHRASAKMSVSGLPPAP
jgi:hypothetical protein